MRRHGPRFRESSSQQTSAAIQSFDSFYCLSVTSTEIRLAVSNATSGSAKSLGSDLNMGAELYFSSLPGWSIVLDKLDDGYVPEHTLVNTRSFIKNGHKLFFNYVGTPTTKSILNYFKVNQNLAFKFQYN